MQLLFVLLVLLLFRAVLSHNELHTDKHTQTPTHTPVWQLNKFCKAFYIIQQKCDMRCCCVRAFILLPCSLCI